MTTPDTPVWLLSTGQRPQGYWLITRHPHNNVRIYLPRKPSWLARVLMPALLPMRWVDDGPADG